MCRDYEMWEQCLGLCYFIFQIFRSIQVFLYLLTLINFLISKVLLCLERSHASRACNMSAMVYNGL